MINQEEYEVLRNYYLRGIRWISRNKNGNLVVSKIKPDKYEKKWLPRCPDEDWSELRNSETYLFLFIQWDDEESYRIADLIKEYEKKKYRFRLGNLEMSEIVDKSSAKSYTVLSLIVEEDEVVKDKEWLKDQVARIYNTRDYWSVDDLRDEILDSINELDEPKKVVVPEEVYEHIKMKKVGGVPLDIALDGAIGNLENLRRDGIPFHEFRNNQDNYAKAWLAYPDIEVEKEQKHYVLDAEDIPMLVITHGVVNRASTNLSIHEKGICTEQYQLTEQEIKDYDERFWAFAVPVEEVEE